MRDSWLGLRRRQPSHNINRNLDLIIELFLGMNEGAFRKLGG